MTKREWLMINDGDCLSDEGGDFDDREDETSEGLRKSRALGACLTESSVSDTSNNIKRVMGNT
jgi:hypothetical protein